MIIKQVVGITLLIIGALLILGLGVADSEDNVKGNLDIHIVLPTMILFLFIFSIGSLLSVKIL